MRMRYAVLALTALVGMSGAFAQCLITDFEGYPSRSERRSAVPPAQLLGIDQQFCDW
jgi:hypothetical protein